MSIRIRTLRELSRSRKRIARVRWRCWEKDRATGELTADEGGSARDPSTWGRWEEEYFLLVELAREAVRRDRHAHVRPKGLIDQVPAREVWQSLENAGDPELLEDYDEGKLRVLYAQVGAPGRLPCDQSIDRL